MTNFTLFAAIMVTVVLPISWITLESIERCMPDSYKRKILLCNVFGGICVLAIVIGLIDGSELSKIVVNFVFPTLDD